MRRGRTMAWRIADRSLYGRRSLQPVFRLLHRVSLAGMNFGVPDPARNGEYRLLDDFALAWAGRRPVILDVGAGVGDWSAEALRRFPGALVFAFEPTDRYAQLAERIGESARTFNFGLSDRDGTAEIYAPRGADSLASLYLRDLRHTSEYGEAEVVALQPVTLCRLDDFLEREAIEAVDFLKIDVEGHELAVLRGAGRWVEEGRIEAIQFEFGGTQIDARVFLRDLIYLLGDHYDVFRILRDGLSPVSPWRERDEIFLYANYLAQRKA